MLHEAFVFVLSFDFFGFLFLGIYLRLLRFVQITVHIQDLFAWIVL